MTFLHLKDDLEQRLDPEVEYFPALTYSETRGIAICFLCTIKKI